MLKDLTLGQYFPGNSVVHRLDARTKILLTLFYMVLIFCIQNFSGYLLLGVFTVLIIRASEIPLRFILKGVRPLLFFILFTAVLNLFFSSGGQVLWQLGFLKITAEGVRYAALMILRIVFLVLGTSLLTYTTSPITLTDGIELLLRPFSKIGLPGARACDDDEHCAAVYPNAFGGNG